MPIVSPNDGLRRLFYLVSPNETSYATIEEMPQYINEAIPYFILLMAIELIAKAVRVPSKDRPSAPYKLNDSWTSIAAGLYSLLLRLLVRGADILIYSWVYERFCIYELPWDQPLTWWVGFFGVDFTYYWIHRFGHEINFFWAAHQTHHSSEYYNLTTALRQSTVHRYLFWIFYLPMAFFVRPSIIYMHMQFNTLYQFWIHTEEIKSLGPLEWILNTPSHHRVHHGRNRYAIDKNYGGTLIIFDRLFGTFAAERSTEQLAYGLVHPLNTFDATEVQIGWYRYIFKDLVPKMKNTGDKLKAVFYGPGWSPEKPDLKLGDINDIPDIRSPTPVYNPPMSTFMGFYSSAQLVFCVVYYQLLVNAQKAGSNLGRPFTLAVLLLCGVAYIVGTFTFVGRCFDNQAKYIKSELKRVGFSAFVFAALALAIPSASYYFWIPCVANVLSVASIFLFGNGAEAAEKRD